MTGLQAQKLSRDRLVESYRGDLNDFRSLLKEGFTEKQKVEELDRALAQNEGQREHFCRIWQRANCRSLRSN